MSGDRIEKLTKAAKEHKMAEIVTTVGAAAAMAAVLLGKKFKNIDPNLQARRTRRQLGYDTVSHTDTLVERIKLFGYEEDTDCTPNLHTKVAAFISYASGPRRGGAQKIVTHDSLTEHLGLAPHVWGQSILVLRLAGLIEDAASLADTDVRGYTATEDLILAEELPGAEPLHQAMSDILRREPASDNWYSSEENQSPEF